jgi:putative peptide zinc metalloprotease protein
MLATGWQSLGHQWTLLRDAWGHDDISGGLAKVLAIAAIAVPLLGTALLIVRLVRRTVRRGWRTTAGHPVRRTLAGVAGLAVIAALAWAWWPNPGTYRPIRPGERGTVQDAVPAARTVPIGHRPVGLHEGAGGRAKTVWAPGRARPTARHPELALLLVPTPGSAPSAPTWVFPFNQPPPPGAGDNQALAVNTTDNSIVYDVAFALVWVTDGSTVDNRNEAYALASCQNCATVAVAFQVVLIVGQAHVAVPQNVAAAVNYACTQCVTAALANQLVLTVPADLSDAAKAKLAEVWRQIEDFARGIQGVPLNQLRDDLARFEQLIAAIIQQDTGSPGSSAPTSVPPVDPSSPQPSAPGSTATDPSMPGSQAPPPESTTTSPPPTSSDPPSTTSPTPAPTTTP